MSWKYQFQFAPVIAAYEKGFYRDAGLDVDLKEGGPGINAVHEVMSGAADYGIFSSALILAYGQGQPVVALASMMQHSPVAIITDSPTISSVIDLADKRIAASPDTRDEIIAYLKAAGLPEARIHIVNKTRFGLDNLEDHDAISAYISNEGYFTLNSKHRYALFSPRSAGIDLFGNILFTSRKHVEEHPEQVRAFREATLKGLVYALEHPEELTQIILARYNSQNKTREHLLYEAAKLQELTRPDIVEPGYMSTGRWHHVAEVYASLGKLPPNLDLADFIYNPNPEPDLRWLYGLLLLLVLIITAVSAALFNTRRLTRQLRNEIRERQEAEAELAESETRFKDLFDKSPDPCWLIEDKRFVECNDEAVRTLGYPDKKALVGVHPGQISPEFQADGAASLDKAEAMMEIAVRQGVHRFEWTHRRYNGETFPVEFTLARFTIRGKEMLYCIWHDIIQRKQAEKVKNEFISTVSHELRTPLTSLIGSLGLLAGGVMGKLDPNVKNLVDLGLNNAERLLTLINDLLDLSKIEAGKLEYQMVPVEVNALVQQAVTDNEHYGQKYGISFQFKPAEGKLWSQGDSGRLLQVMNNLLSNAAKFSHKNSIVDITTRRHGNALTIEVTDHGEGIPPEFHDRIFNKFSQADSSDTRRIPGTGLGLNISKSIVEAHGGSITFNSTPGLGTTFFVTLKIATPPLAQPAQAD